MADEPRHGMDQGGPGMTRLVQLCAAALFVLVTSAGAAFAQAGGDAAGRCQALASTDFSGILDAATQVTSAKYTPAAGDLPAFCDVHGYIQPQIGVQLRLPDAWNGKFLSFGCGGFCGMLYTAACD